MQLESLTRGFRHKIARQHRRKWRAAGDAARAATKLLDPLKDASVAVIGELLRDCASLARWHKGRDNGQRERFKRLQLCGSRMVVASCRVCSTDARAVPEGCGVTRLCPRCSLLNARRRVARFARARQRAWTLASRVGLTRVRRGRGGRAFGSLWADRMVTLTVPHFLLCHVERDAKLRTYGKAGELGEVDTTAARIAAVRAAWPLFARKLGTYWKQAHKAGARALLPNASGGLDLPPMHRAFEWTPGKDGLGHPHFHVWMLCGWLPAELVSAWWTEALRAVGVPLEPGQRVRVDVRRFQSFDANAVGELVKDGRDRRAIEWARLYEAGAPRDAFQYADGWTIGDVIGEARDDVIASLYRALEGARLSQGSAGFFVEDERPACQACGAQGCWHVRFELPPAAPASSAAVAAPAHAQGPP